MRSLYASSLSRLLNFLLIAVATLLIAACGDSPTATPLPPDVGSGSSAEKSASSLDDERGLHPNAPLMSTEALRGVRNTPCRPQWIRRTPGPGRPERIC